MLLQFIIKSGNAAEIETQARRALEAEVTWIEICAPDTVSDEELKRVIDNLRPDLADKGTVLIIGNRYEAAKEWQADGVHVYALDRPVSAVRVALEAWPIIGVNVADREAAESMRPYDIDYLFFESDGTPEALDNLRQIATYLDENAIETPLVCGGDITEGNILTHVQAGAAAIATSDIDNLGTLLHITRIVTQENV